MTFESFSRSLSKAISSVSSRICEKEITREDLEDTFSELELIFLENDVALGVVEKIYEEVEGDLLGKKANRLKIENIIKQKVRSVIQDVLSQEKISLEEAIKEQEQEHKPFVLLFVGANGVGKSLSVAKVAKYLKDRGYKPIVAAGDTYRAAGISQMRKYAKDVKAPLVKHKRGSDSAAVIYDARMVARSQSYDVVLADTAGRSHADYNLLEELKKIYRVNKPNLTVLVIDSLSGQDVLTQCSKFNEAVSIDCTILTKMDANSKGGAAITACHILQKPILFVGIGQGYDDLKKFEPEWLTKNLF